MLPICATAFVQIQEAVHACWFRNITLQELHVYNQNNSIKKAPENNVATSLPFSNSD